MSKKKSEQRVRRLRDWIQGAAVISQCVSFVMPVLVVAFFWHWLPPWPGILGQTLHAFQAVVAGLFVSLFVSGTAHVAIRSLTRGLVRPELRKLSVEQRYDLLLPLQELGSSGIQDIVAPLVQEQRREYTRYTCELDPAEQPSEVVSSVPPQGRGSELTPGARRRGKSS